VGARISFIHDAFSKYVVSRVERVHKKSPKYEAVFDEDKIWEIYPNEELVVFTQEITDALLKNKTIDW